ncbi:hypothetical protein HYT84_04150 [Candidatus Micrarchaeota archaeon]|nr:hypothetical protein [Candidatus Micrarchaeota archaeon]
MGDGEKLLEKGIPLTVLAKQLNKKELERRLGASFDKAVSSAEIALRREVEVWTKELNKSGNDLFDFMRLKREAPAYLKITIVPEYSLEITAKKPEDVERLTKVRDDYLRRLRQAREKDPEQLLDLLYSASQPGLQVKISFSLNNRPSVTLSDATSVLISELGKKENAELIKDLRRRFIDSVGQVILSGLSGTEAKTKVVAFYASKVEMTQMIGAVLKQFCALEPVESAGGQIISFKDAKIPKDVYPIDIEVRENSIIVGWTKLINPNIDLEKAKPIEFKLKKDEHGKDTNEIDEGKMEKLKVLKPKKLV